MAVLPAESSAGSGEARKRTGLAVGGLFLVCALEALLFWIGTARQYAWVYPRWFDQAHYLRDAYDSYAAVGGLAGPRAAAVALAHPSPQGSLHSLLAVWAFALAGPSRSAALAVNLAAFLALQVATFGAVRKLSGGYPLAWAAVGFLAAVVVPWSGHAGSATDFRLDWMAACAYGVALALAILGRGFRSTGWSALFGAAVGVVLLERFLTGVYFGLILLGLGAWILGKPDRWRRLARLALAAGIATAVSGWAFWRSRHLIYDYYWVGHFGGPLGALHDARLGAWAAARWLAVQVLVYQLGPVALGLAAGVAALLWYFSGYRETGPLAAPSPRADAWSSAGIFFAAPALVLLLHPARATQTLVILVPPAAWLVSLGWMHLSLRSTARALQAAAAVAVAVGGLAFGHGVLTGAYSGAEAKQFRAVNALSDYLTFRSEEAGLSQPRLSVTWGCDGLGSPMFRVLGFERRGRSIPYVAQLPTGLFEADPALIRANLAASDFVCLVTRATPVFPFDRQMAAMLAENRQWCDTHLRRVGQLEEEEFSAAIYERRTLAAPAAGGANLAALLLATASGDPRQVPPPPGVPLVPAPGPILWSAGRPLRYQPTAGYGSVRFAAIEVPAALAFAPGPGWLTGRFPQPGTFRASLTATNAMGSAPVQLEFRVVAADWAAELEAPEQAPAGAPVEIRYRAYDGGQHLDYIDVTDLTASKLLARLTPNDDEHESWSGRFPASLESAGPHRIQLRFVRYDGSAKMPYTYLDQERVVLVGP